MSWWLLMAAGILFCCVCVNKFSNKAGMTVIEENDVVIYYRQDKMERNANEL